MVPQNLCFLVLGQARRFFLVWPRPSEVFCFWLFGCFVCFVVFWFFWFGPSPPKFLFLFLVFVVLLLLGFGFFYLWVLCFFVFLVLFCFVWNFLVLGELCLVGHSLPKPQKNIRRL